MDLSWRCAGCPQLPWVPALHQGSADGDGAGFVCFFFLQQNIPGPLLLALQGPFWGSSLGPSPAPSQDIPTAGADSTPSCRLGEEMEDDNRTEPWHRSLQAMLDALNQTLHGAILRPAAPRNASARAGRDDNAYMYILFVMTHFAATVGSLILGYTRSRKVDKRSDPYHVYIKNRVSMI